MTPQQLSKSNKLIADFLGWQHGNFMYSIDIYDTFILGNHIGWRHIQAMPFNSNWQWFMHLYKQLLTIDRSDRGRIIYDCLLRALMTANIDLCYIHAVSFIEWYNESNNVQVENVINEVED
jgi:hypothetical protein